jgi:peptidoglycan/LPS O-acetylase OafA/YrhL
MFLLLGASTFGLMTMGARLDGFSFGFARVLFSYCLGIVLWRTFGDRPRLSVWWAMIGLPASMIFMSVVRAGPLLEIAIMGSLFPFFIIAGLGNTDRIAPAARMLGALSFPFYAVHYPVLVYAKWAALPPLIGAIISLVIAAAIVLGDRVEAGRRVQVAIFGGTPIRRERRTS